MSEPLPTPEDVKPETFADELPAFIVKAPTLSNLDAWANALGYRVVLQRLRGGSD
jgi:hypothetical protein